MHRLANHRWYPGAVVLAVLIAIAAGSHGGVVAAEADSVPRFDVTPSCRAAARRSATQDYLAICRRDEGQARARIEQQWEQFAPADKSQCVQLTRLGGQPTYTELLTCLEMARDVRASRQGSEPATTGSTLPGRR